MTGREWKVWGIGEISDWSRNFTHGWPSVQGIEDYIDAHLACGVSDLCWELGRSVLTYHSDLPEATSFGRDTTGPMLHPPDAQLLRLMKVCAEHCHLRRALSYGRPRGVTFYGRLAMNRHYAPGTVFRSNFAQLHPQWCEVDRDGQIDLGRLCYAIPECRRERVAVLAEAVRIGCDGLLLDFCRQPPMALYHPAMVVPYREATGIDPRMIEPDQSEAFLHWCQFRADYLTQFMRELAEALAPLKEGRGRPIPVQVRVPNDGFEANLIAGIDVKRWCREGLIDELSLSELHWLAQPCTHDDKPYIAVGDQHQIPVYASACCLPQRRRGVDSGPIYWPGINPLLLARRVLAAWEAGAHGVAFYQTDVGAQVPAIAKVMKACGSEADLRALLDDPEFVARHPVTAENHRYGVDNHSIFQPVTA